MDSDSLSELALTLRAELERRRTFLTLDQLNEVARVVHALGQVPCPGLARCATARIAACATATASFVVELYEEDCAIQQLAATDGGRSVASLWGRVIGFDVATRAVRGAREGPAALAALFPSVHPRQDLADQILEALGVGQRRVADLYHATLCSHACRDRGDAGVLGVWSSCCRVPGAAESWARLHLRASEPVVLPRGHPGRRP